MPFNPLNVYRYHTSQRPDQLAIIFVKLFFFCHFFSEYAYETNPTAGPSMLPTLSVYGDRVLISKHHRRGRDIRVGDMVNVRHPMFPEDGAIKRVLGMPGDFVVRGTPESDAPEGDEGVGDGERGKEGREMGMIQVPQGHCWLIGDNLDASRDSRFYGPLPLALIKGKVIARVLPWGRRGWFENTLREI